MAAFCGTCGKPLAADAMFCGGCGAVNSVSASQSNPTRPVQATTNPSYTPSAKTGSPILKIVLVVVLLGGAALMMAAVGAFYFGRKKIAEWRQEHNVAAASVSDSGSASSSKQHATPTGDIGAAFLSKEEVAAIIGMPVTAIELSKTRAIYSTSNPAIEATIDIERKRDEADAIQDMDASRQVTRHIFGGKADKIAGLGDDAVYGAMNSVDVRKGDVILTITPPNMQTAAQAKNLSHLYAAEGADAQKKAMGELENSMKGDPNMAALGKPDAISGAVSLITHSATEQGNEYEKKARLMARQMAEKVLSKLGS